MKKSQKPERISMRSTAEFRALLARVSDYHLMSRTAVVEMLVREEARAIGKLGPRSKRLMAGAPT